MQYTDMTLGTGAFPYIAPMGLDGLLVRFSDTLSQPANRATIAFAAMLAKESWAGIEETSTSLVSVFIRFDPSSSNHAMLGDWLVAALQRQNWYEAPAPINRRLWAIPTFFGGKQTDEIAALVGLSKTKAVAQIVRTKLRVLTIGFAPGQPYLGTLPERWDIPRQTSLTKKIPAGAIGIAIRQIVLFANETPTGWRQFGQTAFQCFRPESSEPFPLRAGDEVQFTEVSEAEYAEIRRNDKTGDGGATCEKLR